MVEFKQKYEGEIVVPTNEKYIFFDRMKGEYRFNIDCGKYSRFLGFVPFKTKQEAIAARSSGLRNELRKKHCKDTDYDEVRELIMQS